MANPTDPKLICAQCGYDNEPERVYCHNCGTKLDRSVLPRDPKTQKENLADTRRRILKMTKPGNVGAWMKTFLNTMIYAALVAAIYLLVMPPRDIPTREQESGANIISGEIDAGIEALQPVTLGATTADISQHVRSRVKGVGMPGTQFKRTYATLGDGKITFGIEQQLFGFPLYSTVEYRPTFVDGNFKGEKVGTHIGRLGIHPAIPFDLFSKVWKSLKRESELVKKAQSITITKQRAVLVTKPASAVR